MTMSWIRSFFTPPLLEGDEDGTRTARLLHAVLLALLGITAFFVLSGPLTHDNPTPFLIVGSLLVAIFLTGLFFTRLGGTCG